MHVPAGHRFPDATGVAFASAWARHRCLQLYLGTEHRWCEDPIESAPFIIRDRAPMVQRTLLNLLRLLLLLLLLFFFFSKLNRILEGLNMLEKSGNFAHASELVKIYV